MARTRVRAAARKVAMRALEASHASSEVSIIAEGVRAVAVDLERVVTPGSLYWAAPFRFVIEQMAPRVCGAHGLPIERAGDVGEYLLAAFNEFVVTLVEHFDVEHFEAWTAAHGAGEAAGG